MFGLITRYVKKDEVYFTVWEDFRIQTIYDRVLDIFITTIKEKSNNATIEWYCTDQWKYMEKQHQKGLRFCFEIICLSLGHDDF